VKRLLLLTLTLALALAIVVPATSAQSQRASIGWEDEEAWQDWDFYEDTFGGDASSIPAIVVQVKPGRVQRRAVLEYFDEESGTWGIDASVKTNRKGFAYLKVTPNNCKADDGTHTAWCDGEWEYRVRVLRRGVYRELVTESVWFGFIPTGTGDDDGIGEAWDF
jgi:hypothetical protein